MKNFIHKYGHIILWLIFIIFMFISLMVLVTQGIVYALVIFVPSLIFLCPPIIKFIQRKTRLKKVVLGIFATIVMSFALFGTSRHSAALKEENIRINQEKRKEEQERKEEQQKNEEEKKAELAAANKKAEHKQKKDKEDKEDKDTKSTDKEKAEQTKDKDKSQTQQSQAQKQVQPQPKAKKVVVRASKKSGQYYTPGHPSYNKVAPNNVVVYSSEEAAARAGYKKAA